eukprot:TRINITY_DN7706_c0_g1_i1.p1 TRINITY_DN7706_c0_g1~~TRINITY_DN7706_c0_g1_i1.p1  ORF type:complete len:473 (-),score=62.08 TRINITY_DN7706_c0_g1_i1:385-1803(-)
MVEGAANVKVPLVVAQLVKLEALNLQLATTFRTTLHHSHITSLEASVPDLAIDIPSLVTLNVHRKTSKLVKLNVQRGQSRVDISNCALKRLEIGPTLSWFNVTNVDWSKLEEFAFENEEMDYWTFVEAHLPKDITLKSLEIGRTDPAFHVTQNKSLMPKQVSGGWDLIINGLDADQVFVQPQHISFGGTPMNGLAGYKNLVAKFHAIERLDFFSCNNITTEVLDIICQGLPNLKQIGFTESRDINAPFSHLKIHSKSLELLYLYHIHSVETSDIVCPNLRTITYDNAGRYEFLENITDTNFCEMTLQLLGETNACPNLVNYAAYPSQTHPTSVGSEVKEPSKPLTLTKIPSGLDHLDLYLNSNLVAIDVESDTLRECSLTDCFHVKGIKLKADVHSFSIYGLPLNHLAIQSKRLKYLHVPIEQIQYVELITPNLQQLLICAPTSDHFLDHLQQLEELKICKYTLPDLFRCPS